METTEARDYDGVFRGLREEDVFPQAKRVYTRVDAACRERV